MVRKRLIQFWVLLLLGGASMACSSTSPGQPTAASPSAPETDRPNIIFMYSDDHTAQAIGAYREALEYGLKLDHSPTPNIDQLAEQGMRFDNAFVTNSICKPSRAVLLSGLHSHLNGVPTNHNQIHPNLPVFPTALQEVGYQTAIIGKWHLGAMPMGFDEYEVLRGQGPYYNSRFRTPGGTIKRRGHTSEIITRRTLNWLKNDRKKNEPFFLMYNHKAPHRNWVPAPERLDLYDDRTLTEPETLFYDYSGLASTAKTQDMEIATTMSWGWDLKVPTDPETGERANGWKNLVNGNNLTEKQEERLRTAYRDENQELQKNYEDWSRKQRLRWRYQRYIKDYLRTIQGIDKGVGRLMKYLEKTGLDENTIVIYSADQGFFLGENGWFDKRWIYEESLRQPLIVRWPDTIEPGSTDQHLVQNLDFAPTLLDMAGIAPPDRMQGRSLVPLMKGNEPGDWRQAIYYHYYEGTSGPHDVPRHYGLRTKRYTLAHYYKHDAWELFDLKKDPEQLDSVYGDEAYRDVQKRLKSKLKDLQARYGDDHPQESTGEIVERVRERVNEN